MPASASLPAQFTRKEFAFCVGDNGCTLLTGWVLSMVLLHSGVSVGGLRSNTVRAFFLMALALARVRGRAVRKETVPCPFGAMMWAGRKPMRGLAGAWPETMSVIVRKL